MRAITRVRTDLSHSVVVLTALLTVSIFTAAFSFASGAKEGAASKRTVAAADGKSIGDTFGGETFGYKVGFWYFTNAALAKISLKKTEDGLYVAELSAATTGVLRFVPGLRHREDRYVAVLEEVDKGRRFRTISFMESTVIGKSVKKRTTVFDYKGGVMRTSSEKDGKLKSGFELPLEHGYLDDPLCAFYNMRFGVYGTVEHGRIFEVRTFPRRAGQVASGIPIRMGDKGERGSIGEATDDFFYAFVKLDKELFSSKSGDLEILFDKNVLPKKAIAKDVLLFGDVYGELIGGN